MNCDPEVSSQQVLHNTTGLSASFIPQNDLAGKWLSTWLLITAVDVMLSYWQYYFFLEAANYVKICCF